MDNIDKNELLEATVQENTQNKTPEMLLPEMYQPKPLFELTKEDITFAVCVLVTSVFTAIFGFFGGFAFGYLLSICVMLTLFSVYFIRGNKIRISTIIYGLLALANSAVFICTTNGSVRFFAVIISFLLSLIFFDGVVNKSTFGNRETMGVFYSAISTVGNISVSLRSVFSGNTGDKKIMGKVIVGLICAIPVLIIVVPLLISSDDAFRGMVNSIFTGSGSLFTTILKAIFGVIISLFVISYGFSLKFGRFSKINESKFKGIENICIISFLSVISLCYFLYLFSQLAYFFSAFSGFLPNGKITYSEYARKGFFEMCVIAVINLILVFISLLASKKKDGKVCVGIKILTTFITVFTLIIITTATSKMVLYIKAYGMTVLRLTTSSFMLFLAVVFIAAVLRIYINKINIVKTALITAGVVVLLLGTLNVNSICAKYNYNAYQTGALKTIDVQALYELGDEGIPYVVRIACSKDSNLAQEAQKHLAEAYLYDYFDDMHYSLCFTVDDLKEKQKDKGFERFSIPKAKAYENLYEFIEKNPQFASKCHTYFDETDKNYFW